MGQDPALLRGAAARLRSQETAARVDERGMDVQRPSRARRLWPPAATLLGALAIACPLAVYAGLLPVALGWNAAWTAGSVSALAGMLVARAAADPPAARALDLVGARGRAVARRPDPVGRLQRLGRPADPEPRRHRLVGLRGPGRRRAAAGPPREPARRVVEVLPLVAAAMAVTFAELWTSAATSPLPASGRARRWSTPSSTSPPRCSRCRRWSAGSLRRRPRAGPAARAARHRRRRPSSFIAVERRAARAATTRSARPLVDPLWVARACSRIAAGGLRRRARRPRAGERRRTSRASAAALLPGAVFVLLVVRARARRVRATLRSASQLVLAAGLLDLRRDADRPQRCCSSAGCASCSSASASARRELAGPRGRARAAQRAARARTSRRDPLTGLRNRRALAEDLPAHRGAGPPRGSVLRRRRCATSTASRPTTTTLGHLAGDQALRALADHGPRRRCAPATRRTATAARSSLLVLRDARDAGEALAAAERVRAAVAERRAAASRRPGGRRDGLRRRRRRPVRRRGAPRARRRGALRRQARRPQPGHGRGRRRDAPAGPPAPRPRSRTRSCASSAACSPSSRAAASGRGALPVLEAVAADHPLRAALPDRRRQPARGRRRRRARACSSLGDEEARAALLDTSTPWADVGAAARRRRTSAAARAGPGRRARLDRRPRRTGRRPVQRAPRSRRLGPRRHAAAAAARLDRRGARHDLGRRAAERPAARATRTSRC